LSPFVLMDNFAKKRAGYDLRGDPQLNVFVYLSVLGSGLITSLASVYTQFVVVFILTDIVVLGWELNQGSAPTTQLARLPTQYGAFGLGPAPTFGPNYTTYDLFCSSKGVWEGKLLYITVILLYLLILVPGFMYDFFSKSGLGESAVNRLNNLRQLIFDNGDDSISMQLGFKLNKYMGGVYVAIVLTALLFILFLTNDMFNLILNALALQFVYMLYMT